MSYCQGCASHERELAELHTQIAAETAALQKVRDEMAAEAAIQSRYTQRLPEDKVTMALFGRWIAVLDNLLDQRK